MREIKFRGYSVERLVSEDQWVKGHGIYELGLVEKENPFYLLATDGDYKVHEKSIGQYTGLKDANEVETYEGDIVKLVKPSSHYVIRGDGYDDVGHEEGFEVIGAVRFLYSMWFVDEGDGRGIPLDFDENQLLEVIGNVYENPELLGDVL